LANINGIRPYARIAITTSRHATIKIAAKLTNRIEIMTAPALLA
jgi:hypothetical protein